MTEQPIEHIVDTAFGVIIDGVSYSSIVDLPVELLNQLTDDQQDEVLIYFLKEIE